MTTNYMSLCGTPEIPRKAQRFWGSRKQWSERRRRRGGVMRADDFKSVASAARGRNLHVVMSLPVTEKLK